MLRAIGGMLAIFLAVAPLGAQSRQDRDRASMGDQGDAKVKFRGVGWVVIRSHHRDRLADFYRALGFVQASISKNVVGLYAGRQAGLEIGHLDSNAAPAQPKTSRTQATMVAVFGTTNVKEVVARAEKAGATMIEKIFSEGNENLYYIGDPDGNVVGFSEVGPMWRE